MSYFPESIMPSRVKDESQDVKGNPYLVNASDVNKHDEEIRAIEKVLGVRMPVFPASGFSGQGSDSSGGWSGFSSFSGDAPSVGCSVDLYEAMENVLGLLRDIRDNHVLVASGVTAIMDSNVSGVDGIISFPSNWPTTTLVDHMHDDGTDLANANMPMKVDDESSTLPDLPSLTLASVSGLPESGYLSIINDVSVCSYNSGLVVSPAALTGFLVLTDPPTANIYNSAGPALSMSSSAEAMKTIRAISLGTNVEVIRYDGVDTGNSKVLNVRRRALGSTSSRHAPSDIVFKGRLSIQVSPFMHVSNYGALADNFGGNQVDCVLRSNGKIEMTSKQRATKNSAYADNTLYAYASWSATLVRSLSAIPPFDPLETC